MPLPTASARAPSLARMRSATFWFTELSSATSTRSGGSAGRSTSALVPTGVGVALASGAWSTPMSAL